MLFKAFQRFLTDEEEKACADTINRLTFFLPPQDHTRNTGEGDNLREPGGAPALPKPQPLQRRDSSERTPGHARRALAYETPAMKSGRSSASKTSPQFSALRLLFLLLRQYIINLICQSNSGLQDKRRV